MHQIYFIMKCYLCSITTVPHSHSVSEFHFTHWTRRTGKIFGTQFDYVWYFQATSHIINGIYSSSLTKFQSAFSITNFFYKVQSIDIFFFRPNAISRYLWLTLAHVVSSKPWAQIPCTCYKERNKNQENALKLGIILIKRSKKMRFYWIYC